MYTTIKILFLITIPGLFLSSCIYDKQEDCGMYLEFIFDYNMEYANSFDPQVGSVDVYVFDEDGRYLFNTRAGSNELLNRKYMYLNDSFSPGVYQLVTVGGMSGHFRLADLNDNDLTVGVTSIEEVKLALQRTANHVSDEFPHLWFGQATSFHYKTNASVFPVYLVRNTNRFHLMLQSMEDDVEQKPSATTPYTFEIVTPEGAAYGYLNAPLIRETITYHPFWLETGEEPENLSVAKLNTMRLFANDPDGYRLIVRKTGTAEEIWSYNLMELLEKTKPFTRPDGTTLPIQEYLDRQGEWNIVVLHRGGTAGNENGFVAVGIKVNGWIIWFNDIEI